MGSTGDHHGEEGPAELLRSFRWTQRLAQKLVRDPGLAADLNQETWARALERFGDALPGRAWLAGTVRSMAFRARRGAGRRKLHETQGALGVDAAGGDAEGVEEVLMRAEAQQRVAAAVAMLPKDLQIAVLLHFQEGHSMAAIAKRLDCSKSAAGDRVQRGVAALRRELQAEGPDWRACCLLAVPFGAFPHAVGSAGTASSALKLASGATSASLSGAAAGTLATTTLTGIAMKKLVLAGTFVALALLGAFALKLTAPTVEPAAPIETFPTAGLESPTGALAKETVTAAVAPSVRRTPKAPSAESVPLAPPDGFAFAARVVDASGQPIARPQMLVTAGDWRRESEGSDDGAVELRMDASDLDETSGKNVSVLITGDIYQTLYSIYIYGDGTGKRRPPSGGRIEDLGSVTLRPAGAVRGRATSITRRPIGGAEINVCDHHPEEPDSRYAYSGVEPDVVTLEDGTFLMGHLAPGMVALGVRHADFMAKAPLTSVDVVEGVTVGPVFLDASPAEIVTGRVLNKDGEPIEGVYVNGTDNWSRWETDQTGADGRFRVCLRRGSPAAVQAHFPGWRQVSPPRDALRSAGEVDIVIEPILQDAAFTVAIVDGKTNEHIYRVGVAVLSGAAGGGPASGVATPNPMVQPKGGLPLDFVPGEDQIQVTAKGYGTAIVATEELSEQAPHLTIKLQPKGGVRGRLLEHGKPVAGVRLKLKAIEPYIAEPREALHAGSTVRLATELEGARELLERGGYAKESVLGLDGDPPPFRIVANTALSGTETNDEGYFQFPTVEKSFLGLVVEWEGRPSRIVRTQRIEDGTLDLGDVEVALPAQLVGRLEFNSPWDPTEIAVVVGGLGRQVPVGEDGSFTIDGLQPGPVHFSLTNKGLMGLPGGFLPFEGDPVFHVNLAPGESRSLVVSLDPYAPSSLALDLKIGGKPVAGLRRIDLIPVDEPGRVFKLWCESEGSLVTADTRALGLCRVAVTQSSPGTGWLRLLCPGPPLDLRPGQTAKQTIHIPAGRIRLAMDPLRPGSEYETFDLVLEGDGAPLEIISIQPAQSTGDAGGESTTPITFVTAYIPPGGYRTTLRPSRHHHADSKNEVVAEFDVLIRAGEITEIKLGQ